ncbi:MAG TPA: hypothetical protein VNW29_01615 [Candidatus Sulfotelmatobacter sp.]|nr:hypothetical protein [Candidatus Sulfotelmatobacter sp.]
MQEHDFIQLLQERARHQKREMDAIPFTKMFAFVIEWLSDHPWRYLIPLAFIISLILRGIIGYEYINFVLAIFRGI